MCHLLSIAILFRRLYTARNAQGISLRTQELYLVVALTRYTDLLTRFYSLYNSAMKIFYIIARCSIICLIRRNSQVSSTYDQVQDNFPHWKLLVVPCALLALVLSEWVAIRYGNASMQAQELLWTFSILLEAVAIFPQLSLLRRYRVIDNLTGNYVLFLGMYRFFYIINWIYRAKYERGYRHHYVVYACGCIQVILYAEFFYYWVTSKVGGRELSYGGEGDTEYYDCNVNELRNYDNSSSLIDNSDVRMRGKNSSTEELDNLLVV